MQNIISFVKENGVKIAIGLAVAVGLFFVFKKLKARAKFNKYRRA